MDPMEVLPQELVLHICSFLPIYDLVRLWELNHSWRKIVTDPCLWRDAVLAVEGYEESEDDDWIIGDIRDCIKVLRRAPCLGVVSFNGALKSQKLKQALLETKTVVLRINDLFCHNTDEETDWMTSFIQSIGERLEEILVTSPSNALMNTLISLPRLKKLEVYDGGSHCDDKPPVQSPGFFGQLKVFEDHDYTYSWTLPPNWLVTVLKMHCATLEEISLTENFRVLQDLVQAGYQFKALKRLINYGFEDIDALGPLLPGVDILYAYRRSV
ncbi:uncharacterized protein LOC117646694 [Thrips palmi]|uniref:Uncharacterized protein LOC117646694 n=1 Tax=Thrips palmi TaxID=161013 RepID=A0A6P8Z273_THRPL|nr:uncharacterized protein LOC117646694 [Thrips palmi]XP_034243712.1 uncharacterized protein LOC117646694 [Thrips palmi]XP_034243722.1 uncharacterized protein LOC117646694 [Thrips palmi]XP_034243729.1 uncharacterized protein LOC117646694 [Thrips palmi]XP_034243737.1 uncharacterized protein LOC117646694 [Thrips palmi]XP_034243746.1 uncharacterized protein LOC117646694 [Thrips palmi]XP_034243755.1 uncharacterized protein LOC117646694 [Thrips palmi]XP_034243763.1 uncharacterized protein LOC1176